MKIAICQFQSLDSVKENLEKTQFFVKEASNNNCDIIVFPELWISSFNALCFDEEILLNMAKSFNIAICGSNAFFDKNSARKNKPYNRFSFYSPLGKILCAYDKAHLFAVLGEDKIFQKGNSINTFSYNDKIFAPAICYDIRFPELFRKQALSGADIFLVSSAFPKPRDLPWEILLRARAIENQAFVIAVNRAGSCKLINNSSISFFGKSRIIDPLGNIITSFDSNEEGLLFADIDFSLLEKTRNSIKCFEDRRQDLY